jgi:Zn2+/Cd2+-exporting ATPase
MTAGWLAARVGLGQSWTNAFFIAAYIAGGIFGVQASFRSLRQWTIDVDLLMTLAALGAVVVAAPFEGAMLLFLFSFSNVLQAYAIGRIRKAIHSLMKLRPDKALTRRGGNTVLLPIEQLSVGDVVIIRPGERIALDSMIVEGESSINESSLTGESIPVLKKVGDSVFAAVFYRAMTVMVVASPCALIISMPASILSAIGGAARRGVLFKGGVHLERTATIKVIAFDKTGTPSLKASHA